MHRQSVGFSKSTLLAAAKPPAALASILFALCSCGPRISDQRVEKVNFPSGEIFTNESHIETESICLRHCEPQRPSKLTIQPSGAQAPEEVGELRPRADSGCCLLGSMKPVRLERSRDLQVIVFGTYLFTKWNVGPSDKRRWNEWNAQQDNETNYFLRHFPCNTPSGRDGPNPCFFAGGSPYQEIAVDLEVPVARVSRPTAEAGWPAMIDYSALTKTVWQFDFDRTLRDNPGLIYRAFPSDLQLQVLMLEVEGDFLEPHATPEDFTRHHPAAHVIVRRAAQISTTVWTIVSGVAGSSRYSDEVRAAYGDPDPDWVTIYTRFTGWKGHDAHFLRIGAWLAFGSGPNQSHKTVAKFIRVVHH